MIKRIGIFLFVLLTFSMCVLSKKEVNKKTDIESDIESDTFTYSTNIFFIKKHKIEIIRTGFIANMFLYSPNGVLLDSLETSYVEINTNFSGKDLTGNGKANLVVESYSGGAHCCYEVLIYEINEKGEFQFMQSFNTENSTAFFTNLDKEKDLEMIINDWTFAYWKACFAESAAPEVIFKFDGKQYSVCPQLMRRPVSEEYLNSQLSVIKEEMEERAEYGEISPTFIRTMIDLIYTGNMNRAGEFFKKVWNGSPEEGKMFLNDLKEELTTSPWWNVIQEINKGQSL